MAERDSLSFHVIEAQPHLPTRPAPVELRPVYARPVILLLLALAIFALIAVLATHMSCQE